MNVPGLTTWPIVMVPLLLAGCAGTTPAPAPDPGYLADCIQVRGDRILAEWARHESIMAHRIVHPDWRTLSRKWARIECQRGHPVAAFHPTDSAT
ncbi:MAG: hypothetical protein RIE74_19270, partial [Pseudomonadales bacterium]